MPDTVDVTNQLAEGTFFADAGPLMRPGTWLPMRVFTLKLRLVLLLAFGRLLVAAAQQAPAAPPFSLMCRGNARVGSEKKQFCEVRDLTLPAPVGQPLTIDGGTNGSITVHGWAGPEVRVRALVQSGGRTLEEAQARVQSIAVQAAPHTLRATPPAQPGEWLVRYEVFVPHQTDLVLHSGNGNIRLQNLQARMEFHAGNGDVTLTNLNGYVTGEVINGTLRIVLAGNQWEGEGLDVRTTNGTVRWTVPASYSARLQFTTLNGRISTDLPTAPTGSSRQVTAAVGQGGTLLKAATLNGNIYFGQEGRSASSNSAQAITRLKTALAKAEAPSAEADSLLAQARRLGYVPGQVVALGLLAATQRTGQPTAAAAQLQEAAQLAAQLRDASETGWALSQIGRLQARLAHQDAALADYYAPLIQALTAATSSNASARSSAAREGEPLAVAASLPRRLRGLGAGLGDIPLPPTMPTLPLGRYTGSHLGLGTKWLDTLLAGQPASPQATRQLKARRKQLDRSQALSTAFAQEGDYAQAYHYYVQYSAYKDSLTAEATTRRLAALAYRQNLLKKEAQIQRLTKQQLLRQQAARRQQQFVVGLAVCVGVLALFSFVLSRSNRARRQANAQLNAQKETLQQALAELKTTQGQLVQAEKMASLGELTAGIAHEIQNPLNFVNNFADVSAELATELAECQQQPTRNPELEAELLADVRANLLRIHQHGQRASGIVKSMLEHARTSSGQKEPTNLNVLLAEYGKLAYHSTRAKDKTFEADLTQQLDPNLGLVPAASQELGRVLLNIFTNAFYAVQQKRRTAGPAYRPEVQVHTQRRGAEVRICIRDNGAGIPVELRQKVFQPFFTTKPTGEGTGLGLSLSYDIITKGHGGTLALDSQEGEFTEFTITLPLAN